MPPVWWLMVLKGKAPPRYQLVVDLCEEGLRARGVESRRPHPHEMSQLTVALPRLDYIWLVVAAATYYSWISAELRRS